MSALHIGVLFHGIIVAYGALWGVTHEIAPGDDADRALIATFWPVTLWAILTIAAIRWARARRAGRDAPTARVVERGET